MRPAPAVVVFFFFFPLPGRRLGNFYFLFFIVSTHVGHSRGHAGADAADRKAVSAAGYVTQQAHGEQ